MRTEVGASASVPWAALGVVALCACQSTAPYTLPAAGIHAVLGLGMSARQRAEGGCYATCTSGTECNPRSGFCEPAACGACRGWETCIETEVAWRCLPNGATTLTESRSGKTKTAPPGEIVPGFGVSPLSGTAPPHPASRGTTDSP